MVQKVEENCEAQEQSTHRKKSPTESDVGRLAMVMKIAQVFHFKPGREFKTFPKFDEDMLSKLDLDDFVVWIKERMQYLLDLKVLDKFVNLP